jgi:hypothetical protein
LRGGGVQQANSQSLLYVMDDIRNHFFSSVLAINAQNRSRLP